MTVPPAGPRKGPKWMTAFRPVLHRAVRPPSKFRVVFSVLDNAGKNENEPKEALQLATRGPGPGG